MYGGGGVCISEQQQQQQRKTDRSGLARDVASDGVIDSFQLRRRTSVISGHGDVTHRCSASCRGYNYQAISTRLRFDRAIRPTFQLE